MAILLTNDDGIDAPGLAALAEAMEGLDELVVSAPSENQSGVGMSISLGRNITTRRVEDGPGGLPRHAVDGTPSDAVKYGMQRLLRHNRPRLVVSGINMGPNLGVNVRCSGTVGAAFEAVVAGVPAVAVSIDFVKPPNWEGGKHYARLVVEKALAMAAQPGRAPFLLNLNVPSKNPDEIPGLIATHHGTGGILDIFTPNEDGESYRLRGKWAETKKDGCDFETFMNGYAVITPLQFEMTNHRLMSELRDEWKDTLLPHDTIK